MADYIIIVAGGKGLRMGEPIPKQFLQLNDKAILMHTLEKFYHHNPELKIILALPSDHQEYWTKLCSEQGFDIPHIVVNGGQTRFHSVLNALGAITDDSGVTGVHDGVRPFVTPEVIDRCFNAAKQDGAAIPVIFPADSIREADDKGSHARNRDRFRLVQTPQVFRTNLLKKAYSNGYRESFTDDASVVEAAGHAITLVEGNQENIKITSTFDMMVAHVIVSGDCDQKG